MTDEQLAARVLLTGGPVVERLVCHPVLPMVAGMAAERPVVHLWALESGEARQLATLGADEVAYDEAGWDRYGRTPSVSWHPTDPALVAAVMGGLRQWTPAGFAGVAGPPSDAAYRTVAFSPDGRTVWAVPGTGPDDSGWGRSDAIDLESGTLGAAPEWDTGIAAHPGGELVVTFRSDQGATLGLFARIAAGSPAGLRVLRRALILDVDGYRTPLFSPDGRYLAIRGNAYEHFVQIFEFPSLRRVLTVALDEPSAGVPYSSEDLDRYQSWSWHNLAFTAQPGVLVVGTPDGTVIELNVETQRAVEYDVLGDDRVTALAVAASGELLLAGGSGSLVLVRQPVGDGPAPALDPASARQRAASFLAATSELPDDIDLDEDPYDLLELTDGTTTWESEELATITTAEETDPTWLRRQAMINTIQQGSVGPARPG